MKSIPYILPFYHCVSDVSPTHLKHLYSVRSVKGFKKDIDYIGKRYEFVDLNRFYELAKVNFKGLKKKVAHLTFDDGLRECSDIIGPMLMGMGIPASFFINTTFVDNKDMLFRFKASLLIDKLAKQGRKQTSLYNHIINLGYKDDSRFRQLAIELEVDFEEYLYNHRPYMSWKQIKNLADDGFAIGAHSKDHPEFRFIDNETALMQIQESMRMVSSHVKGEVRAFSFPFTDFQLDKDFFRMMKNMIEINISFGTAGIKSDEAHMNFQRIPMECNYSASEIIGFNKLKAIVRSMIGNNIVRR